MVSATGNIEKKKSRNLASFLRIKKGLKKKAFELSTLVGIDVCMIIVDSEQHGQGSTDHCPVEPGTYPDNSQEVYRIIQRYREYITTTTTTTTRDEQCGGVSSTTGVLGGKKKRRNNQNLIQKNPAEIRITSSSSDQDQDDVWSENQERALIQALRTLIPTEATVTNQLRCWEQVATAVPGKKTVNQCKKKFALLMKGGFSFNFETEGEEEGEELENEFMGFDQQNVNFDELQRMTEELEELLADSSCTSAAVAAAYSSSEFLVEGDKYVWPSSDHLDDILHGFGDGDHHEDEESMFDMLPLSPPPLPLTNAFISNRLNSTTYEGVHDEDGSMNTSDKWLSNRMVEWDQIFI